MLQTARKLKQKTTVESEKKRANGLNGKQWIQNSISIWSDISKDGEERNLQHPAMFPWSLAAKLIETFTHNKQQNLILDPFVGSGSTLIACQKLGKSGVGIDLNKEYIKITKDRLKKLPLRSSKNNISEQKLIHGSAESVLMQMESNSIDFTLTSPPYWNILTQKRTVDMKEIRNYSKSHGNLGYIDCYEEYIANIQDLFDEVYRVTKNKSYCVVNVMDLRKKNQFYPLHMDISLALQNVGFVLDDIIIWDRRKEYNNLRPLGYPYVFRVNKVHEFLLIFRKLNNG